MLQSLLLLRSARLGLTSLADEVPCFKEPENLFLCSQQPPITIEFNTVHTLIAYPIRFIIVRFPYLCLGFPGDLFL
jgi:hypothetical protein